LALLYAEHLVRDRIDIGDRAIRQDADVNDTS
jgi:hypothetical protein